jgi:hypothetical protein
MSRPVDVFYVLKWEFTQNNDRRLKIGALNGCRLRKY